MLTGTPLDLTPFGGVLQGIGVLYWLLAALGLWWALRGERPWKAKLSRALPAVLIIGALPGFSAWQAHGVRKRFDAAQAHFETRCKNAGIAIARTVDNVAGVLLLKVPPGGYPSEADPMTPGAARFSEPRGEWYIRSMLRLPAAGSVGFPTGYDFVETVDGATATRYRYRLVQRPLPADPRIFTQELEREIALGAPPRYGVTYDDLVDPSDRSHWVAGDSFRVLDTETNEVLAERLRFVWDTGLGSTAGGRSPWGWAGSNGRRCPTEPGRLDTMRPLFVQRVLVPMKEK